MFKRKKYNFKNSNKISTSKRNKYLESYQNGPRST